MQQKGFWASSDAGVPLFTSFTFSHSVSTLNSFCVVQYGSSNTWSHVKLQKVMLWCFSLYELNRAAHTCTCLLLLHSYFCTHSLLRYHLYFLLYRLIWSEQCGSFFSFFPLSFAHNLPFRSFNWQLWVRTLFVFSHLRICDRMCVCGFFLQRCKCSIFLQVSKIMMLVEIEVNLL